MKKKCHTTNKDKHMHIHKLISALIPVEIDGYIITYILVFCNRNKNIHNIFCFLRKKRFFHAENTK